MKQVPFNICAVDMDGTFMNSDNQYDRQYFKTILQELREQGVHFIAASGRPLGRLQRDFAGFTDRIDMIADNGCLLVRDNKLINTHHFTHHTAMKLLRFISSHYTNYSMIVCGIKNSYVWANSLPDFKQMIRFYYPNYLTISDFSEIPEDDPIDKLTIWLNETTDRLEQEFNSQLTEKIHATASGYRNGMDIVPYGTNKATGLKYFLNYFDTEPQKLIAFGDGQNDIEMLQLAGFSYAMANAKPELKKAAKYRAPDHNKNGVLRVLASYLDEDQEIIK